MFKNIKIGLCVLAFSLFGFISTSQAVSYSTFHGGNTLIKGTLTVKGGITKMETILPADIKIRTSGGPVLTITTGGTGNVWQALQFDGGSGSSDDFIDFPWVVPDGYVTDSLRYNIFWSCESAETILDTATFDGTVLSVTGTESVDAAVFGMAAVADVQWDGIADLVYKTVLNPEVTTITIDDILYTTIFVDESESMFTDTIDIHYIQREWESIE